MANINELLARAAALRNETALNSISPERAGGIMYDTLIAFNELWLQQGAALVISKIYASVDAMEADTDPVSDLTGQPLRPGQIVVIASSDSDNGSVYRYDGPDSPSWSLVGKIGNLTPVDSLDSDSTQFPLAAHQGKVLDGKISQLSQQVIYDVSENNGGVTFASLSALLYDANLSTLIPISVRCGGMNIRFVQTSDNSYVQYRLMSQDFTTDISQWQMVGNDTQFSKNQDTNESSIEIEDGKGYSIVKIDENGVYVKGKDVLVDKTEKTLPDNKKGIIIETPTDTITIDDDGLKVNKKRPITIDETRILQSNIEKEIIIESDTGDELINISDKEVFIKTLRAEKYIGIENYIQDGNLYTSVRISDFVSNTITDSEAIDAAFSFLSIFTYKRLIIDVDVHLDKALLLPSNTILELRADIYQNDYTFDNVIRTANVVFNEEEIKELVDNYPEYHDYVPITYPENVPHQTNVKIIGNGYSVIASEHVPTGWHKTGEENGSPIGYEEEMRGDDWGSRGILMCISNTENVYIENVTLKKAHCYSMSFDLCKNVRIRNVSIYSPIGVDAEEDGIDIRTGCKHFLIENIHAETGDDAIAINAAGTARIDSSKYTEREGLGNNHRYLYPLEPSINNYGEYEPSAGFDYTGWHPEVLDVEDIVVRCVKSKRVHSDGRTAIILADLDRRISNVLLEDFHEMRGTLQASSNPMILIYYGSNSVNYPELYVRTQISNVRLSRIESIKPDVTVECLALCLDGWANKIINTKEDGIVCWFGEPNPNAVHLPKENPLSYPSADPEDYGFIVTNSVSNF